MKTAARLAVFSTFLSSTQPYPTRTAAGATALTMTDTAYCAPLYTGLYNYTHVCKRTKKKIKSIIFFQKSQKCALHRCPRVANRSPRLMLLCWADAQIAPGILASDPHIINCFPIGIPLFCIRVFDFEKHIFTFGKSF